MSGDLFQFPFVVAGGIRRYLACKPPHSDFGSLPKFATRPVNVGEPALIPRSQWTPIDRRDLFPASTWIMNQGEIGSCVGNGSAGALRRARFLQNGGDDDIALSPGCLYAQINGGVDQGAVISDALAALIQSGTCDYATVGESPYYMNQLPSGWQTIAQRFRIDAAYHCEDFDSIGSALQLGYIVVYGIMVGNNFQNFDQYGVAGHAGGPGNHCMMADGMTQLPDGRWCVDDCNSWGSTWGPWNNGRCYLDEQHFQNGDQPDAFAIQAAVADPENPNQPPVNRSAFGIHRASPRTH